MLQPVVVLLVLLHEVSVPGTDDRPVDARKLLGRLVALIGAVLLVIVAVHVFGDVGPYTTRATLLSFVQPVILSVVVIAFAFLVALLAEYKSTFVRVGWHKAPSRRVRLAKLALLPGLGFRLRKLHGFRGTLPMRLSETTSWVEARQFVRAYKNGELGQFDRAAEFKSSKTSMSSP